MAKITLENIKKIYQGNVTAVHDFNLEIKDKEFVVFVGPSGCGKSTTLRMIAGLEEISEGSLKIDDVLVNDLQPKDRGVSMVFQNYALYPHLSVFENLAFPLRLAKVPTEVEKTEKEIEEIEKQILLIKQDIDTLNTAMVDEALVAKTEEEINRKCDPLLAKIEANKEKAATLQAKKECREFVQKKVEEAQVLDDEISKLKAKAYAEDTPKEEAKKLVKEIKAKEKALAKVRNKAEHPVPAGKLERINDALNALSYKNVLLEEKVNNIKKTTSLSVRLDSFKEELERLEQEKHKPTIVYKKVGAEEIYERVTNAAEILGITQYLNRKPRALSGGQRQRVAIGRAMVKDSKVFLMDEPLSNLDAKLRNQMRAEIILLRQKIDTTFIYVTHDQTEAMTLGDRIVVMKDGYIMQVGSPEEVFDRPANLFVAEFIGAPKMNTINCALKKGKSGYSVNPFGVEIPLNGPKGEALKKKDVAEQNVILGVRPEHIDIHFDSVANSIPVTVQVNEMMGSEFHLHVLTKDGTALIIRVPTVSLSEKERHEMVKGKELFITFEDKVLHFFNVEDQKSLLN